MGLIGKNGAGKSTTLKAILRLVAPDAGEVRILGRDFRREETACKQEMGIVLGGIDFYMYKKLAAITDVTRRFYPQWDEEAYRRYWPAVRPGRKQEGQPAVLRNAGEISDRPGAVPSGAAADSGRADQRAGSGGAGRAAGAVPPGGQKWGEERAVLHPHHLGSGQLRGRLTYLQGGRVLQSRDKAGFLRAFDHLKRPEDTGALTLAQIMIRTERGARDDDAAFIRKSGWLPIHPSSFSSVWGR